MPYSQNNYPDSLKNLDPKTRNKAIEIINSILEDKDSDLSEGQAIATGIKKAKQALS
ncbi:MAG: hypothetical protein K9M51_02025 [Candidatus Gracilibacteria bacterium]|nr:hypothetical protein [Candidatus Gracilibacteria bacterium]